MNRFPLVALTLSASLIFVDAVSAGPLRILYLGQENTAATDHAHVLMREFGRDAIWFDYTDEPVQVTPDWLQRFDAVFLDAPRDHFESLAALPLAKIVKADFSGDASAWDDAAFLESVRGQILNAAGLERREDWEAFLAQREPEQREPNPNIANYERRPEPITLQHPFSVKGSVERTQVPVDMRLELFAAEPDIAKPIAFAWDEGGRLWVCETRDYPHDVERTGRGRDSIKICEDTDGDGRADKFTVFADELNIPTSLVFANGGIVVTQPPRMLFLKDSDGDDRADVREVIMEGWGIGDTHAQANNLHWGYDNWLYGCVGYSGFNGTVGGEEMRFGQGTYRFKADGSALEFLHQFSNNSWGHSANSAGDQFGGTANGAPIFYGGLPASVAPDGFRMMTAKKINVEDKCHTITPNFRQVDVFGGYTAAAGSAFIYSANLPQRLQGMAMVCEPTMKVISLMDVQPDGAGYVAKDGFNLVASSDEWMSPVFAEVGPDGAVWFADWQNFIIQHNPTPSARRGGYDARTGVGGAHENPLRDHQRGRIYRVVWEQAGEPKIQSLRFTDMKNLQKEGRDATESERKAFHTQRLIQALRSDNQFWRLTAQRLLVEGNKVDAVERLKQRVTSEAQMNATLDSFGPVSALHALWTLHGLGHLDDETHRAALLARDATIRRNAVRALGHDEKAQSLYFSSGVVSDPNPITRLAAMVKLAEFETSSDIKKLVGNLARNPQHRSDEWLAEATKLLAKVHDAQVFREGPNLLPNPGFETVGADGLPADWRRRDYGNRDANDSVKWESVQDAENVYDGERALRATSDGNADTSLYTDVTYQPNTQYRLSAFLKADRFRGKLSLNDHINRWETESVRRSGDWTEVEVMFQSGDRTRGSINVLHVGRGEGYFDNVRLSELLPLEDPNKAVAGDIARGREIFFKHTAACVLCHQLNGEGSTVGPPLDGIASRQELAYIKESLMEPSKVLAEGYENLGLSPMPPMGDIFTAQEMADIQAFVMTLKEGQ